MMAAQCALPEPTDRGHLLAPWTHTPPHQGSFVLKRGKHTQERLGRHGILGFGQATAVSGQRHEREIVLVHMVLDEKVFRESRPGKFRFVPRPRCVLGPE